MLLNSQSGVTALGVNQGRRVSGRSFKKKKGWGATALYKKVTRLTRFGALERGAEGRERVREKMVNWRNAKPLPG